MKKTTTSNYYSNKFAENETMKRALQLLQKENLIELHRILKKGIVECTSPSNSSFGGVNNKKQKDNDDDATTILMESTNSSNRLDLIPKIVLTELWKDDEKSVLIALKKLANMCFYDERREMNRKELFEAGGHATIIGAMNKWLHISSDIIAEGCRTIHNSTMNNQLYSEFAVKVGAIQILCTVLNTYMNDTYIQRVGLGAIHSLTKNNLNSINKFINLNGIKLVVNSMSLYPNNIRLQMWSIFIINDMSQWETIKVRLLNDGALVALATTIQRYNTYNTNNQDNNNNRPEIIIAIQDKARNALTRLSCTNLNTSSNKCFGTGTNNNNNNNSSIITTDKQFRC